MNRAERRRRTAVIVLRRMKCIPIIHPSELAELYLKEEYEKEVEQYYRDLQRWIGRNRHMHPWDCGRSRCQLCSHTKILKIKTRKEKISDIILNEQIKEMFDDYAT